MTYVPSGAPWSERGGRLRGVVDLLAGRYPPFVFGFGVGALLPVFHFHETTVAELEPAFQYLVKNGYRTLSSDEMADVVYRRTPPPSRAVVLAFDDALASLWLVATPLLKRYGLRAVTYAIPGRISDADGLRPTIDEGPVDGRVADAGPCPLATWPELRAMAASGHVDVQSHTWSHTMMFCGDTVEDVQRPDRPADAYFNRPRLNSTDPPDFLAADRVGFPLFARRSRMSEARRYFPDDANLATIEAFVAARGGPEFFRNSQWRSAMEPVLAACRGRWETDDERLRAIEHELVAARDVLQNRLGSPVRHVCLPWGVTGQTTRTLLERLGFSTAVANRLPGRFAVQAGDDPFYLKRLPHGYIYSLPGEGRRTFKAFA